MKHELVLAADVEFVALPGESSPRISSQIVAKAFGKNHKDLLRSIIKWVVRYKGLGLTLTETGRLIRCSRSTVHGLLKDHPLLKGGAL